ncbi:hypothetical protein SAMN05192554_1721 [Haloarchaeobius iranensis]|uniref:HEAT repeat-containing protein n=2 Tax=Haloarchaeobius iranensis TaxID=996166 RepID=A0A1H0CAU2_9EURY|nr:hypothetical protein SAMN05192554_1721 [Haloarchaeobius iranensis]
MLAAAIVRELSSDNPVASLGSDDPLTRRQSARYLGIEGVPETISPVIVEALVDGDPHIRAGVTWGLFKRVWLQFDRSAVVTGDVSASTVFEQLTIALDDADSRVRAGAIPAVALLAFHHEIGEEAVALSALADGLADQTLVRQPTEWLLGTYIWKCEGTPSSLAPLTAAAIAELGDEVDNIADGDDLFEGAVLDAAIQQLDDEGLDIAAADTETITAVARKSDGPFDRAGRLSELLLDRLAADPRGVTEALVSIADSSSTILDNSRRSCVGAGCVGRRRFPSRSRSSRVGCERIPYSCPRTVG